MRIWLLCLWLFSSQALAERILLTNDDGYQAPGITALFEALSNAGHDVTLVAPATQQSGSSASITSSGVKLTQHAENIYSVTGKPADAVLVGLAEVFSEPPDLVISGANFGQNSGQDAMISGTVGAATMAHSRGIPAIAISVQIKFSELEQRFPSTLKAMPGAGEFVVSLLESGARLPQGSILNINYPAELPEDIKGVIATKLADYSLFDGTYRKAEDGTLRPNFNLQAPLGRGTDAYELSQGYITLTRLDGTYGENVNRRLRKLAKTLDRLTTD
ncbi:MAG: 5'/3'-nucleotidase SurE [Pseudomonadales bacterium]|jgi:5'-nucleotidase